MTSGSGSISARAGESGMVGRHLAWKYCTYMEGNKYDMTCNYCGLTIKSGCVTQFKYHLLLGYGVQVHRSLCQYLKRKLEDL